MTDSELLDSIEEHGIWLQCNWNTVTEEQRWLASLPSEESIRDTVVRADTARGAVESVLRAWEAAGRP